MDIKIASWNINSIRARETSLQKWIVESNPDIFGLQETKVIDDQFPVEIFYDNGYDVRFFGQKSYNGVAIISKHQLNNINNNFIKDDLKQSRVITAELKFKKKYHNPIRLKYQILIII